MLKLIGNPFFPFVRKVSIALEHKEMNYEVDPLNPVLEKGRLLTINSIGKVPVLGVKDSFVPESAVICKFLDKEKIENPLYPTEPKLKKQAEAIEDWGDTVLAQAFGGGLFLERVLKPYFFNQPTNEALVNETLNHTAPALLVELETVTPKTNFRVGEFSIADITIANWVYYALLAGLEIEKSKYPKFMAYLIRVFNTKAYQKVMAKEKNHEVVAWAKAQYVRKPNILLG